MRLRYCRRENFLEIGRKPLSGRPLLGVFRNGVGAGLNGEFVRSSVSLCNLIVCLNRCYEMSYIFRFCYGWLCFVVVVVVVCSLYDVCCEVGFSIAESFCLYIECSIRKMRLRNAQLGFIVDNVCNLDENRTLVCVECGKKNREFNNFWMLWIILVE